jgi:heme-degrading monooxygenase HmoA
LPALEAMDGFCAAMLCADRPGGRAVAVTTWRDHDALRASTERANTLRQEVRDKAHAEIAAVMELEVVISQVRPS